MFIVLYSLLQHDIINSGLLNKKDNYFLCSIDLTEDEPACCSSTSSKGSEDDEGAKKLSLISWNVDGLDTLSLAERARGLCSYLAL